MDWTIEDDTSVDLDLERIAEHLRASYLAFGDGPHEAAEKALGRVRGIRERRRALARTPHIGTRHDADLPGLRHVTMGRAVYWFVLDEPARTVRLVGVFYGGQDHFSRIMDRVTGEGPG